jgi:putative chitinase
MSFALDDVRGPYPLGPARPRLRITPERLKAFAPNCYAEILAPHLQAAAERYAIDTLERASHWLGQLHVESAGLTRFWEDLNYSAKRLCAVWPGRFPSRALAQPFARNPEALAEKVYGGRMGNVRPGDGYRFRGRGLIQLTGRANYEHFAQVLGIELAHDPDLAAEPETACLIAGAYWHDKGLNAFADLGDILGLTRKINGGQTGLADRSMQTDRARRALAG